MSIEAVNQFLNKVNQDSELQAELSEAVKTNSGQQAAVELAAKYGYNFSQQELNSQIKKIKGIQAKQSVNEELKEEELGFISGGFCTFAVVAIEAGVGILLGTKLLKKGLEQSVGDS